MVLRVWIEASLRSDGLARPAAVGVSAPVLDSTRLALSPVAARCLRRSHACDYRNQPLFEPSQEGSVSAVQLDTVAVRLPHHNDTHVDETS